MFYWQYVKGIEDRLPCVLIKGEVPSDFMALMKSEFFLSVNWIVEDGKQVQGAKNVLYRERARLTDKEWLRGLSNIDYLVCDENDVEYWGQVALCGVKIIFRNGDFSGKIHTQSYLERIENWEWAKNLLT